jgi:hypothetical protein
MGLLHCPIAGVSCRRVARAGRSDGLGQPGEYNRQSAPGRLVGGDLVVAAAQVPHERVTGGDHPLSFAMCQARREVLLGADRRCGSPVARVLPSRSVAPTVQRRWQRVARWWRDVLWSTWAGARANATLAAALPTVVDSAASSDNDRLRARSDVIAGDVDLAMRSATSGALPEPPSTTAR